MSETTEADQEGATASENGDDEQEMMKEWGKYSAILFAIAGVGVGLFYILYDAIDEEILEANGIDVGAGLGEMVVVQFAVVAIILAPFLGAVLSNRLEVDENTGFKVIAVALLAGVFVFFLLSVILTSTTFDDVSVEFGGLLINSIIAGIVAAIAGVGGAWAAGNQSP